jgi:hypothetical protein
MTTHEEVTAILKDELDYLVSSLEKGQSVLVRGGYIHRDYKSEVIDRHCDTLVDKLTSMGYGYTTNHGHGCRDYYFMKKIEL